MIEARWSHWFFNRCKPFADQELYPTLVQKAAVLGFFLIQNHPFLDGNKRVGHAAMETLLVLNGSEVAASAEEQEAVILSIAKGKMTRAQFTEWLGMHVLPTLG